MTDIRYEEFKEDWVGVPILGFLSEVENPGAAVLLIHGFGEHSGRYVKGVVPFFNQLGYSVLGFDLVGHGKSGGKRGYCEGYDQLMALLGEGFTRLRGRNPNIPILLFGHSLGGNLVLNFVLREYGKPEGIIASSPYLRLAFQPPAWKWHLGKLLGRFAPTVTVPSGLDPRGISQDEQEVQAYLSDPLIHDRVSPAFSFPVIEAGEWAIENAGNLGTPTLILHGSADPIIDPEGSRAFFDAASVAQLEMIDKGYHELHHDLDRKLYFKAMETWLKSWNLKVH
ncbi:MAG: lysophospholipase [Robiginitalea sp.]|uniref:alpha/beta hydrolase n=1 Tax=Robiginitalea sp. TaxID=1902411 RepID=UPI003C73A593